MITIYDIAKRANVSPATVSRVLNGYPDVSQKTREKVQRITTELGFQPNAAARGLATKRSWTIGVFFQDHVNSGFKHPFLQDVLKSFKDVMGAKGYDLLFFANHMLEKEHDSFAARARHRNVDGVLLLGVPRTEPTLNSLVSTGIPCMSVDLDLLGPRAGYLCSDNKGGALKAMAHLVEMGHRRIAFIGDRFSTKPGHDRLLGYQEALSQHSLTFRQEWIAYGDFTEEGGYAAMQQLLSLEERPTAVFCAGDMMAIGAMSALREAGLQPGPDVSVIGFDDIAYAKYLGLTTVAQHKDQMGMQAAQALLQLIDDSAQSPAVLTIGTELVLRQTVHAI
ncbi:LacI family DNA-binding transcriptional regulator [Tumebacillus permanentifrigoris]|uniref:LacI family transcriptional regulator n=1 Tax=Tumebacillus permanentifrigoris TaxID=378543 RepID=A0A316DC99_9BACL|nr:LacI family DNA-binding transcriptional regulator [Tumebacillus permanentifrigoris]PWK14917.1 LacI family transcriptional regulator [Tumebacillus permanentifrigoris]